MPQDNRVSAEITAAVKGQLLTKLGESVDLLPMLLNFTEDERQSTPGLGPKREAMVEAFSQEMAAHPELVPSYVDMAEVAKDRALRSQLLELAARVHEFLESLEDTAKAAGADLYLAYMGFYANVQQAARRNVPGADSILQTLQQFIPRGRRTPPANQPTP